MIYEVIFTHQLYLFFTNLPILGKPGKVQEKILGESGILVNKISGESGKNFVIS